MMLSAVALRTRLSRGEITIEGAIRQSLEAIDNLDRDIRAFVALNRAAARRESAEHVGPLSGIAIGVKDIIDTADMPTEMGSAIYAGWRPKADAALSCCAQGRRQHRGEDSDDRLRARRPPSDAQPA